MQVLIPYAIRIISVWVAAALAYVLRISGVDYMPDELTATAVAVAEFLIEKGIPAFATIAAIVKISLDKFFNKGNASAATIVKAENAQADFYDMRKDVLRSREQARGD